MGEGIRVDRAVGDGKHCGYVSHPIGPPISPTTLPFLPSVQADLENGLWAGADRVNNGNMPLTYPFVFAMVKGKANGFALKAGDATQGKLQTMWDGPRPPGGYQPMKKQGSIILGVGGDNSAGAVGVFFEGVITANLSSDAADEAVHANVVAASYGQ